MLTVEKVPALQEKSAEDFVQELNDKNIRLWVEEGALRYKAPKGAVSEEILQALKQKKEEILQYLQAENDFSIFFEPIQSVGEKEHYPLSAAQNRMLILNQIDRDSKAYNITQVLKMEGDLDIQCLGDTIRQLIGRHDALRTTFSFAGGKPVQIIHPSFDFEPEYVELQGTQEQADKLIHEFSRPYELDKLPLFSIKIIKLIREDEGPVFFMLLDMHHIISDGVTLAVLVNEINLLYAGQELPELTTRYVDYSVWYEKLLSSPLIKAQKRYWHKQFEGELPSLRFPSDHPRPAFFSFNGRLVKSFIEKPLADRLYSLAKENRVTLYTVLFSAFSILIGRYAGREDVVIGTPTAGRRHADVQNILGNFVNTLAIRSYPELDKTFQAYLAETGTRILQAFDNQDYPFDQLVNDLKIQRDLSKNPLFDVMFILQNMGIAPVKAEGIEIADYETGKGIAQFDVTVIAMEMDDGIDIGVNYCAELFEPSTMERFAQHYKNILEEISGNPQLTLGQLTMLSEQEQSEILHGFNDTKAVFEETKTIHGLFEEQAARTPDNIAATFQDRELSYRELNSRANRLAHRLRAEGVGKDTLVAVVAERSLEMMVGIMAALKAGGAYLPVSPSYPEDRIRYMLEDSRSPVILTQQKHAGFIASRLKEAEKGAARFVVLTLEDESLYTGEDSNPEPVGTSRNLAYVIYTSGSTGRPKGVMIEHRSLINRLNWMQKKYPLNEADTILQKTPYTFDVSVWELFWWSVLGAKVCFLIPDGEKDPQAICEAVEKNSVTTMHFVPSMLNAFLEYLEEFGGIWRLKSLKRVFASGEALTLRQVESFNRLLFNTHGTTLHNLYGPTEATVDVSYFDCSPGRLMESVPIGKPIDNIRLYVLDKKDRLQPVGIPGELCIAGDGLARGYLNREELTAERFVPDPYVSPLELELRMYRSGDLAKWLPDGNIEYLGRLDNQVKIRGFRIELGEIEAALLKHQDIKEAVVIVREDNGNKALCAYVVPEKEITVADLRAYLTQTLPDYMVPGQFVRMEKLPLTASGKADRRALPKPDSSLSSGTAYEAPRNAQEQLLADIWAEILGLPRVGIKDDFFAIGGDSLKAIKVVERVNREQLEISLLDIMHYHSIEGILGAAEEKGIQRLTEAETFSFDKMLRRNDKKIKMLCNAKERVYNKAYSPIEYPFYYLCMFTVLVEYLKYVCHCEMELDFLNASVGALLAGIEYIPDETGQDGVLYMKGINASENAGYPNALEKLKIGMIPKTFSDKDSAVEYLLSCLAKNQIVPVTVSTYHLNYTCDYHLDKDQLLEKVEYLNKIGPGFIATAHSILVVDATKDSFIVHDTTFSYFGEVPKEDFYKAFEGVSSIEAIKGHKIYEDAVPFEAFELITDDLCRRPVTQFGREEVGRTLKDYICGNESTQTLEDGQTIRRLFGIPALEKIIELFKSSFMPTPYNEKLYTYIFDVFENWGGAFTLLRNAVRTLRQYHPLDAELVDQVDRLLTDCHAISNALLEYKKENHPLGSDELCAQMEEALHFQKTLLGGLAGALRLN